MAPYLLKKTKTQQNHCIPSDTETQVLLLGCSYLLSPPVSSGLLSTPRTLSHPSWEPQSACAVRHLTGAVLQHGQVKKMSFTSTAPGGAFPLGIHTCFLKSTDHENKSQRILLISAVKKPTKPKTSGWRCLVQATPGTEMQAWL